MVEVQGFDNGRNEIGKIAGFKGFVAVVRLTAVWVTACKRNRYGLAREALEPLLLLAKACFDQGQSVAEVLEVLMPA
ncbi:hypothetical protein IQ254_05605 [Nodosilinea sp. LEGE 07088]|uniref:hypothetical protein n=1 Tax=Nodosilinea sp. LEGE 07088 TaxID=2777968 RepID=UPI0018822087|nr:hypothetical protein [Nodosilinea sp. LEGE 07088]MBE9136681.1 hypothetical protein [Nodosilinea sp. LEGE 07088]